MKLSKPRLRCSADLSAVHSVSELLSVFAPLHNVISREVDFLRNSGWSVFSVKGARGYFRVSLRNERGEWASVEFSDSSVFSLVVIVRNRITKLDVC